MAKITAFPQRFTPLKNFDDADLRSSYEVGLGYTIPRVPAPAPADASDEVKAQVALATKQQAALTAKVEAWLDEGKVRLGDPDIKDDPVPEGAQVSGSGNVQ